MTPALILEPGLIVKIRNHDGLWKIFDKCKDSTGLYHWALPVGSDGRWNRREGWHAVSAEGCSLPKPLRTKRAYRRKVG